MSTRPMSTVRFFQLGLVLLGLLLGSGYAPAADVAAGKATAEGCAGCHGADGKGKDALKTQDFASSAVQGMSDAELTTIISDGKGKMPGYAKSLKPDQIKDSLHAYQISKRGNSLRVMAEAVRWGKRGARVNTISPGIIITPLANDELKGPRGAGYRRMLEVSAAGRAGTPDEVGTVGALLMGPDGAFITGSDFLMDGGVTAAYWYGELAPKAG